MPPWLKKQKKCLIFPYFDCLILIIDNNFSINTLLEFSPYSKKTLCNQNFFIIAQNQDRHGKVSGSSHDLSLHFQNTLYNLSKLSIIKISLKSLNIKISLEQFYSCLISQKSIALYSHSIIKIIPTHIHYGTISHLFLFDDSICVLSSLLKSIFSLKTDYIS